MQTLRLHERLASPGGCCMLQCQCRLMIVHGASVRVQSTFLLRRKVWHAFASPVRNGSHCCSKGESYLVGRGTFLVNCFGVEARQESGLLSDTRGVSVSAGSEGGEEEEKSCSRL